MKKLYEKNELTFALVWIAIYVVGTSLAEALSESISVYKLVSAVFHIALTAVLFLWVRRNGLMEKYGLFLPRYRLLQAWFFIPLALVCLYKLVFSPALRFSATESILFVISMLCVGFLEELIFRGFLFRAIEKENLTRAIIISSVTFGIVILFHKGKSLVPCIVFHGVFNALSVIANDEALNSALGDPVSAALIMIAASAVILGGYSLWNWKHLQG